MDPFSTSSQLRENINTKYHTQKGIFLFVYDPVQGCMLFILVILLLLLMTKIYIKLKIIISICTYTF
jgi:hypothetical protein